MAKVIGTVASEVIVRETNREDRMPVANVDISICQHNADGSIEIGSRRGVFFGILAGHAKMLLKMGANVEVIGREVERDFETTSGQLGLSYEIIANGFKVLPADYDMSAVQTEAEPKEDIPF